MVKIIRKKKRLFEDDNLAAAPVNNPAPANTATPAPANTQPNNAQPANDLQQQLQPQQTQDQNQLLNLDNQQNNQTLQAVLDILKNMENQYWCIANNVPEMIKEKIPDFKPDNAEAAPIIKNWDAFKLNPSELTFNAFIDSFKNFGNTQATLLNVLESLKRKAVTDFRSLLESRLQQANQDRFTENVCKYYF